MPALQPLQPDAPLSLAAERWAAGASLEEALRGSRPARVMGLRLSGPDDAILQNLRQSHCRAFADPALVYFGVHRHGQETWVLLGSGRLTPGAGVPVPVSMSVLPSASASASASEWQPQAHPSARPISPSVTNDYSRTAGSASQVLALVNEVRASGTRCGGKSFAAAPALRLSGTLDGVAAEHAQDMARQGYFEHVDLRGNTPADRVRATGYREKLVGENIAYGPESAQEVVAGWLHSNGHCENIMDPRFVEMGLAVASGQGSKHGLYWDQMLATPVP